MSPLRKGKSPEVVSSNIKEMIKSGYKQKQAVAASLAKSRKYKMSDGGYVEGEDEDEGEGLESQIPQYPMHSDEEGLSPNVERAEAAARGLQAALYAANDNHVSYEADDEVSGQKMNKGGQVQPEEGMALGNKPDLDWIDDGNGEPMSVEAHSKGFGGPLEHAKINGVPMSDGLSEEAKKAIMMKKKNRKYGSYNPV